MTDTATPAPAPRRKGLAYVFFGEDGLRAGWSILLYIVLLVALSFAFNYVAHLFYPAKATPDAAGGRKVGTVIFVEGFGFAVLALAAFIVSRVERRPFSAYGLRSARLAPDLLAGMVWGLVMLSLLVGVLAAAGLLVFDGVALAGAAAAIYAAEWFLAFLFVGLLEEFLFRGFLQYTLARGVAGITRALSPANLRARTIGFWVAAFVFSVVLFALAHVGNGGETLLGIAAVSSAGLVFVYSLYRTGSLWWAIGFHATWDWAQSYLYGVADSGQVMEGHLLNTHPAGTALLSGGTTGPEGSILVLPTLLLTALIIRHTLPRRVAAFDA